MTCIDRECNESAKMAKCKDKEFLIQKQVAYITDIVTIFRKTIRVIHMYCTSVLVKWDREIPVSFSKAFIVLSPTPFSAVYFVCFCANMSKQQK